MKKLLVVLILIIVSLSLLAQPRLSGTFVSNEFAISKVIDTATQKLGQRESFIQKTFLTFREDSVFIYCETCLIKKKSFEIVMVDQSFTDDTSKLRMQTYDMASSDFNEQWLLLVMYKNNLLYSIGIMKIDAFLCVYSQPVKQKMVLK